MTALNARIPSDLYQRLGMAKYQKNKSIQEMVTEALRRYLDETVESPAVKPPPKRK